MFHEQCKLYLFFCWLYNDCKLDLGLLLVLLHLGSQVKEESKVLFLDFRRFDLNEVGIYFERKVEETCGKLPCFNTVRYGVID